jgi:glycerol-3-phosphate dehydrogenase
VLPFSARTRSANLTRMAEDRFDVLVIGGGITGAGIALDAAARGFSVALVEQDDFASGTSGRSSRLVDDARLTNEVARAAHGFGGVLANHARVTDLLGDGRVTGAVVADEMTGQRFGVRARVVVNAAGVWADRVTRLAGSGGSGGSGGSRPGRARE